MGLPISTNWKEESYDFILVIIYWLIRIIYYKPVKVIIDILGLANVILDVVVWHHSLLDSIITDWGHFSPWSSGHRFVTFSKLNGDFPQPSSLKLIARLRGKIA